MTNVGAASRWHDAFLGHFGGALGNSTSFLSRTPFVNQVTRALSAVVDGPIRYLLVSAPPRIGVSTVATAFARLAPVRLEADGQRAVAFVTYTHDLAVVRAQRALAYPIGTLGSVAGRGFDCIVADDLIANTSGDPERVARWLYTSLLTRLEPDGRLVLFERRWPGEDLVTWLMRLSVEYGGPAWHYLPLPAVADPPGLRERAYGVPNGWTLLADDRPAGAPLSLWDDQEARRRLGSAVYRRLYRQRDCEGTLDGPSDRDCRLPFCRICGGRYSSTGGRDAAGTP